MNHRQYSTAHRKTLFEALHANAREGKDDWDQVFTLMRRGQQAAERADLKLLTEQFSSGRQLVVEELREGGQFFEWELQFMQLGMAVGDLSAMYERIAQHYQLLSNGLQNLRKHLWIPLSVLMLIAWCLPLSAYATGQVGLYAALRNGLVITIPVLLLVVLVPLFITAYRLGWIKTAGRRWFYRLPGLGKLMANYQTYHYLRHLAMCIDAGFTLQQALKQSARRMPDTPLRSKFNGVFRAVDQGERLSSALEQSGILQGIPVTAPRPGMTAQQAQLQLTDSVYLNCLQQVDFWSRFLPWMLLGLAPVVVLVNAWPAWSM